MLRTLVPSLLFIYFALVSYQGSGSPVLDGRIVGGDDVSILNYPYHAGVEYLGNYRCGGAIIARTWVLTAAQCVDGLLYPSRYTVRVGTSYSALLGDVLDVYDIIPHENFNSSTYDYDIALLRLLQPITLTPSAKIVQLPINGESVAAGTVVSVTGFGYTTEGGSASLILQEIDVPVWLQALCVDSFAESKYVVSERMFCAGLWSGGKDACNGDGGGPLVGNNSVLYGLVSWGLGCGRPEHPGVYTNVSAFRDWITYQTGI